MDPLSALSVAAAVIQFVDFGLRLASNGLELYADGSLTENDELEAVTRDITRLTKDIASTPTDTLNESGDEACLKKLAITCQGIGEELLDQLEKLRLQPSGNRVKHGLESFRKSLRSARKKGKIQSIETRLKKVEDQIKMNILKILNNKTSRVQSSLNRLSDENRSYHVDNEQKLDKLRAQLIQAIEKVESSQSTHAHEAFNHIRTSCLELMREGTTLSKSQGILRSLKCNTLRESAIKDAYGATYEWIFGESAFQVVGRPSFSHWLKEGSGIYWISGKAGSGKSTLMKLLGDSERTKKVLQKWSMDKEIFIANFFFWNAGSRIEKSQQGLLQSILYQILKQCPELIPAVCSSRWGNSAMQHDVDGAWSRKELDESFLRLKDESLSKRFCLLIDGLDEYDGDERDIVKTIQNLALSSTIKICASSRPWNAFQKAFGGNLNQKLRLQDFTKDDIRLYAKGNLEGDADFSANMSRDSRYLELVEDIVERSSGVFLWVYFVVRSLLRGLSDDNDLEFMRKRLNHFPSDLGDYFKLILNSTDKVYRKYAARIFMVMLKRNFRSEFALTALSFHYLDKVQDNPEFVLDRTIPRISNEEGFMISEKLKLYLNACCKDLLDVLQSTVHKGLAFMSYDVEFLHRTVKDFLLEDEIFRILQSNAGVGFDPNISIMHMLLCQLKGLPDSEFFFPKTPEVTLWVERLVDEIIYSAKNAEERNKRAEFTLLNELESIIYNRGKIRPGEFIGQDIDNKRLDRYFYRRPLQFQYGNDFLTTVARAGLHHYVAEKLDREPQQQSLRRKTSALLGHAVLGFSPLTSLEMVRVLLARGADPNAATTYTWQPNKSPAEVSIWSEYLVHRDTVFQIGGFKYMDVERLVFEIVKEFLGHGADPEVKLTIRRKKDLYKPRKAPKKSVFWSGKEDGQNNDANEICEKVIGLLDLLEETISPHYCEEIKMLVKQLKESKRPGLE